MALTRPAHCGLELDLDKAGEASMRTDKLLFSESSGFVIEAKAGKEVQLVKLLKSNNLEPIEIGTVTNSRRIVMKRKGKNVIDLDVDAARKPWIEGLAEAMR
jgi:phosphoribosylformylglycinamidine (FGAM) synthase-like enzyme